MAVYITFRDKGIEAAKIAVAEDSAGNYEKALDSYSVALDFFKAYLKYEKNTKARETITEKASQSVRQQFAQPGFTKRLSLRHKGILA